MVNTNDIEKAILDLEARDTSYATVERLAWLYIVRDHLLNKNTERTGTLGSSEFLEACSNVPVASLLAILGDHLQCVKALYPKEYNSVIEQIRALKNNPY